ncbi:MAG: tyrosine-type recombinase/integrase [Patescibacteria group bacterium]|nr:tyrosine-type recombinase/integrase [Patescibacteria group bacterium]
MVPLKKAHEEFVEHLKKRGRSSATILAYGKDIDQLVQFLMELQKSHVHEITKENLEAFMAKLASTGYTPKSISRKTNSTKTFFKFLKVQEYISDDPASLLSHPKVELKAPRILSKTEYAALRDACRQDIRTYAIIEILLQTGVRIGELARIKVDDLKFTDSDKPGELEIHPIEGHEGRIIPLNRSAQSAVKAYLKIRPDVKDKTLFVTKTGNPLLIRNIRSTIDRYFRLAEIPNAKVNDLRHTFVAHHLKRGASLVLVSKIAGHKRLSTTEKYLAYIERPKEEVQELAEL